MNDDPEVRRAEQRMWAAEGKWHEMWRLVSAMITANDDHTPSGRLRWETAMSMLRSMVTGVPEPIESDVTIGETVPITERRLFDLVRYMRNELLDERLITLGEWTWLTTAATGVGPGSVSSRRLEDYDEIASRLLDMERLVLEYAKDPRSPIAVNLMNALRQSFKKGART